MYKNSAQCLHCGDIIHSKHRHDWVSCSCWDDPANETPTTRIHGIFVDGGNDYIRHGFSNINEYKNLSQAEE